MKLISNSKEKKKKKGKTNCNKRNASVLFFFIKQKEQRVMYRRMNTFYLSTNDITHNDL